MGSSVAVDENSVRVSARKADFELRYIAVRGAEQRCYTDEQVAVLPEIASSHVHYKEWQIRKRSCERLIAYLKKKEGSLNILEVGCGNGWLSARLAEVPNANVTGVDINETELKQAATVFSNRSNLHFKYGDIRDGILSESAFDVIVFAASIQYFPSLTEILKAALRLLRKNGEIHLVDSFFYKEDQLEGARQRSETYYTSLGFPEMAQYYFHHRVADLQPFKHKIMHDPTSVVSRMLNKNDPFYWIRINESV